jgi:hypothetical protein
MGWRWAWDAGHLGMTFLVSGLVHVTASVARPGEELVVLDEGEAPAPRAGMEIRASGLWADAIEEEAGQRWTIGLEAFALAVEHPEDVVGRRVPVGFDLEWERSGPDAYGRTPARVHGEVLVEDAVIELDVDGWWTEGRR